MKLMRAIIVLFLISATTLAKAQDSPYQSPGGGWGCITDIDEEFVTSSIIVPTVDPLALSNSDEYFFMVVGSGFQCKQVAAAARKLRAVALTVSVFGWISTCTGIGTPVNVIAQGLSLAFVGMSLHIGGLDCVNSTDQQIEQDVRRLTCETLQAQGIECNPHELEVRQDLNSGAI